MGNNSTTDSSVPVAVDTSGVLAGKTVTAITAGDYHTCAVADGRAYCWGNNSAGQLGNNSTTDSRVPVAVDTSGVLAGRTVTAISAGDSHTCAVADGRAYCWGYNDYGQLGNNSTTNSLVPVAVDTSGVLADKTITAITAGDDHTCAVADGQAYCWGATHMGNWATTALPLLLTTSASTVPGCRWRWTPPGCWPGGRSAAITAGGVHSCAVADGRAYCWGSNGSSGRLGNNSTRFISRVPVAVASGVLAGKTVTAITAGDCHTCAVADGQAYCWGRNKYGRLGNNGETRSRVPVAVNTAGPLHHTLVTAIAAGGRHTAAIAVPMTSVPPPPTAVTGIKAAVKKRPVKITWKPVTAATSYRVRISKPGGKKYKKWKTTSTRVFKTKVRKGTKYRFQVAAVGVGGRGPTTTKRFKAK